MISQALTIFLPECGDLSQAADVQPQLVDGLGGLRARLSLGGHALQHLRNEHAEKNDGKFKREEFSGARETLLRGPRYRCVIQMRSHQLRMFEMAMSVCFNALSGSTWTISSGVCTLKT